MQQSIRQALRQQRQAISKTQKTTYAKELQTIFFDYYESLLTSSPKKIASYYASDEEISPRWIDEVLSETHALYYPVLHPFKKRQLFFAKETESKRLNKYHLEEPLFIAKDILAPWELDMIIVPLVGFDSHKNRIGMGGGFYDSSLALCKTFNQTEFVGIAFDEQQFDKFEHKSIAMNDWDIKMDTIITPTRIIR
ncbi:5-formyltetrahydrofolate cyclo-ligase [Cysteiniphilum sp. QT6929]|uniref:5-formyltetrahydrofolate cyclo-ligase n=1 Tax=Cysteiniphilum sp. QT6929 TaxID=2975055 RepID=UPI0024B3C54E|nr:5-formyltetrahydrofolate cyclo-ligase [Cysteiniphilum sp. QT6929]WHN65661.1 5-formyltetrahydrofolate cyclo-ligase [Cysteiniphilum sp. QT6929]